MRQPLTGLTSRRSFLAFLGIGAGSVLVACSPAAAPAPTAAPTTPAQSTTAPTQAPTPAAPATAATPTTAATPAAAATPTTGPAAQASSQTAPAQLEIWEQEASIGAASEAAKAFAAKYPTIQTKWIPTPLDQTPTKLLAAIAAGSGAPDVAFIQYNDMIKFTTRDGAGMVDLRDYMKRDNRNPDDWVKWALALVTTKTGKILGLTADIGVGATFYRRDVFEAAKLPSEPEKVADLLNTWDSFLTTGTQLVANKLYLLNDATAVFDVVRQQGKQAYFDDAGKPIVNSPGFVTAAQTALKIRQAKLDLRPASGAESSAAMKQGKVGTYFSAAWYDIIIAATAPETQGHWGVVPLPGGSSANFGGSYYTIPAQKNQRDQAWTLISFISATQEGLRAYLSKIKFLPGWKPIFSDPLFTTPDPHYAGQVWLKQFTDNAEKVPEIALNVNDPIATEVMTQAIKKILDNNAPVQQTLDDANKEIEQRIRS